jgi:hypothetical protein
MFEALTANPDPDVALGVPDQPIAGVQPIEVVFAVQYVVPKASTPKNWNGRQTRRLLVGSSNAVAPPVTVLRPSAESYALSA